MKIRDTTIDSALGPKTLVVILSAFVRPQANILAIPESGYNFGISFKEQSNELYDKLCFIL